MMDKRTPGRHTVMTAILELVGTPGFEQLPPIEQDYLIELLVFQADPEDSPFRTPPLTERPLS